MPRCGLASGPWPGQVGLCGAGAQPYCSLAGAGADRPRAVMGSWAGGRAPKAGTGRPGGALRSQAGWCHPTLMEPSSGKGRQDQAHRAPPKN